MLRVVTVSGDPKGSYRAQLIECRKEIDELCAEIERRKEYEARMHDALMVIATHNDISGVLARSVLGPPWGDA